MELQQRSYELQSLATSPGEMQQVGEDEVWEVWNKYGAAAAVV